MTKRKHRKRDSPPLTPEQDAANAAEWAMLYADDTDPATHVPFTTDTVAYGHPKTDDDAPRLLVAPPTERSPVHIRPPLLRWPDMWRFHDGVTSGGVDPARIEAAAQTVIGRDPSLAVRLKVAQLFDASPPTPTMLLALASALEVDVEAEMALEAGEPAGTENYSNRVRHRLRDYASSDEADDAAGDLASRPLTYRNRQALHRVVRWFARRREGLTWGTRRALMRALGLTSPTGHDWSPVVALTQTTPGLEALLRAVGDGRPLKGGVPRLEALLRAVDAAASLVPKAPAPGTVEGGMIDGTHSYYHRRKWHLDRIDDTRTVPSAAVLADAAGVTPKTIRGWRDKPWWPGLVLLRAAQLGRVSASQVPS